MMLVVVCWSSGSRKESCIMWMTESFSSTLDCSEEILRVCVCVWGGCVCVGREGGGMLVGS